MGRFVYLVMGATLALSSFALPSAHRQEFLGVPEDSQTGWLRRFDTTQSGTLERVLQLAQDHTLDVWQVASTHVDIYSPASGLPEPTQLLDIPHTTSKIISTRPASRKDTTEEWDLQSLQNSTFHDTYHPLYEIDAFVHELVALYPNKTRVVNLGHSGEGREMLGLVISSGPPAHPEATKKKKPKKNTTTKPGFVIVGAQHAREWIATATSLYIAHALVADATESNSMTSLLDHFDFHIIPSPNPDGYDYTWESDRFWYKNRQVMDPHSKCLGLDMNRNWGYKWSSEVNEAYTSSNSTARTNRKKTATDSCSDWFPGHRPFEAPEVNNIANYVTTLPDLIGFVDLRSYGQMLSSPFSYSCKRVAADAEDQIEAALGAAQAMKMIHGTQFMTGNLCSMLYQAPGNILDWMYARASIKYAYAVHLRDTGTYGFSLPSRWIRPVGEETANMVKYLAQFIAKHAKKV